ncbi:hypothetical protein [Streptomyces sp. NPDC127098]|uniref:hypothetical protein n=1 Tax=Streptomyces sp. NPDC127098 TaxID=3347137 RepID=UPI003664114C
MRRGTRYHLIDYAAEQDLGRMERGPRERASEEGERIEVSMDRRGPVDPVAAARGRLVAGHSI